jgi:hypothetical protein
LDIIGVFKRTAKEVAALNLYEEFYKKGWTPKLSRQIRNNLAPTIVRCVTLAWLGALQDAKAPIII